MATLDAQLPQWAEILWSQKRYIFVRGGRGSGKSRSTATALVLKAYEREERILCGREVQLSIRDSSKRMIDDEIDRLGLRYAFDSTDNEIRNRLNGSLFMFTGLRQGASSVRSKEGISIFWADEAQAVSEASIESVTPTIRAPGSQLIFTWNPLAETDPVDKLARGMKDDPDAQHVTVNYDSNPWFPEELRRDMERDRRRDPDKHAHIWLGGYQLNSEARVFRNWIVAPFETPDDATFRFGADWGFAVDPTVLVRCFIGRWEGERAVADNDGDVLFVDREAYSVACEIDDTPALFAGDDTREPPRWENRHSYEGIPGAATWTIVADSARPETISYMQRRGFKIEGAVKGPGSVEDGVEFLKTYDIAVHNRCRHTADELLHYSYKIDPLTRKVLPVLKDKDNHVIDALRYASEAVRRLRWQKFEFASAGRSEVLAVTERDSRYRFGDTAEDEEGFGFGTSPSGLQRTR